MGQSYAYQYQVKADVVGGSVRTLDLGIYRTTDLLVVGETYGYNITPTYTGTGAVPTSLDIALATTDDSLAENAEDYSVTLDTIGGTASAVLGTASVTTTIDAGDVPSGAQTLTCGLTPVAHGTAVTV